MKETWTMHKIKVGVLTFSDGRDYLHKELLPTTMAYQNKLVASLEATQAVEVVAGTEIIWTNEGAVRESKRLAAAGVQATIFNYAIWCYPHLTALASSFAPGPLLLFCNIHPSEPGMVGMLAAAGTLEQLGRFHERLWGDISEAPVLGRVLSFLRAAGAVGAVRGQTFGLFGGRPLGMYTAVSPLDQWMREFGVDVEHVEQHDIVRLSAEVE